MKVLTHEECEAALDWALRPDDHHAHHTPPQWARLGAWSIIGAAFGAVAVQLILCLTGCGR